MDRSILYLAELLRDDKAIECPDPFPRLEEMLKQTGTAPEAKDTAAESGEFMQRSAGTEGRGTGVDGSAQLAGGVGQAGVPTRAQAD
jgi:hypothetical protein